MLKVGLSVLKPAIKNLKNVDTTKLGWVRPDKTISFANENAATSYAKNRILQALRGKNPFERGLIVDKNVVLKEYNGDISSINVGNLIDEVKTQGTTFLHGHPTYCDKGSCPISLNDFITLINAKFKKLVVFNPAGEHNTLEKTSKSFIYRILPKRWHAKVELWEQIGAGTTIVPKYINGHSKLYPKELQPSVKRLLHANVDNPIYCDRKLIQEGIELKKDTELLSKIGNFEIKLYNEGNGIQWIHEFLQANAPKIGYKYTTNFSNLK